MSGSSGRGRRDEGVGAGEEREEAHRGPRKKDWQDSRIFAFLDAIQTRRSGVGGSAAIDCLALEWLRDQWTTQRPVVPKKAACLAFLVSYS